MARVGRPFKKGNTASKGKGRPKLTIEQQKIKDALRKQSGKLIVAKYCLMEYNKLLHDVKNRKLSTIERFVCRVIEKGVSKGDVNILMWVFSILDWNGETGIEAPKITINIDNDDKSL